LNQKEPIHILCLQETKLQPEQEEKSCKLPEYITKTYPYRYWSSNKGTTQRKGFSGTAIWSSVAPISRIETPETDEEGRLTALEFPTFNLVSVYTPNSGSKFEYRIGKWNIKFAEFIANLKKKKPTIVCGDLNVCHQDIDIHAPERNRNKTAGFLDIERVQFQSYLDLGYLDVYRSMYPEQEGAYTWWSPFRKSIREGNKGWRLDYFLASWNSPASGPKILQCEHLTSVLGSDHCPIKLKIKQKKKKQKKKAKATNAIITETINEAIVQCHGDTHIQLVCDVESD
jgi:exodeoxyribonuclease-3